MPAPVYLTILASVVLGMAVGKVTGFATYTPEVADAVLMAAALTLRTETFRKRYPLFRPFGVTVEVIALVVVAVSASVPLSYAVQVFNNPMQDHAFVAFDRMFGFDYPAFMAWMTGFPTLYGILGRIYGQFGQVALALFVGGLAMYRDQQIGTRFFVAFQIAVMMSSIISGLFPAEGAVILLDPQTAQGAFGASPLDHLTALRSGQMHVLPPLGRGGIISFPSMHVGLGLLILFYTRHAPIFRAVFGPIALIFIFTALSHGAHYIADMVAAVPMIATAVFLTETLFRRTAPVPKLVAQVA